MPLLAKNRSSAIALLSLSSLAFGGMSVMNRIISLSLDAVVISAYRFIILLTIISLPLLIRKWNLRPILSYSSFFMYALSAAANMGSLVLWIHALNFTALGDASSLYTSKFIFILIISLLLLSEKTSSNRLLGAFFIFSGGLTTALLAPTLDYQGLFLCLLSAFLGALMVVCNKVLTKTQSVYSVVWGTTMLSAIMAIAVAIPKWQWLDFADFWHISLLAFFSLTIQFCTVNAYKLVNASILAPYEILPFISASLGGLFFFQEPITIPLMMSLLLIATGFILNGMKNRIGKQS